MHVSVCPGGYDAPQTSVRFMSYHFVRCPKYRREVITGEVESRLREIIGDIAGENGWEIMALETMPYYVHMFIRTSPRIAPNNIIAGIKGRTSRILRNGFPQLRRRLPTLWTRSYFLSPHGNVTSEAINRYVEEQKDAR